MVIFSFAEPFIHWQLGRLFTGHLGLGSGKKFLSKDDEKVSNSSTFFVLALGKPLDSFFFLLAGVLSMTLPPSTLPRSLQSAGLTMVEVAVTERHKQSSYCVPSLFMLCR